MVIKATDFRILLVHGMWLFDVGLLEIGLAVRVSFCLFQHCERKERLLRWAYGVQPAAEQPEFVRAWSGSGWNRTGVPDSNTLTSAKDYFDRQMGKGCTSNVGPILLPSSNFMFRSSDLWSSGTLFWTSCGSVWMLAGGHNKRVCKPIYPRRGHSRV